MNSVINCSNWMKEIKGDYFIHKRLIYRLDTWLSTMLEKGQVTIKEAEKTIDQAQENISMAAEERGECG
jgi:hypothetical protein